MMESYVTKVFFVDEAFMGDLKEASQSEYESFVSPAVDTKIIMLPLRNEEVVALTEIIEPSAIRPGSIVVKPKYSDEFVPVDDLTEDLVLRRYSLLVQLCVVLGAKSVSISSAEGLALHTLDEASVKGEAHAGGPGFSAGASAGRASSTSNHALRASNMNLNTVAKGGEPDLDAARELMERYGLHRDTLFSGLVTMRQAKGNQLQRHEIALDFSKDISRVFDSTMNAKLDVMSKIYKGKVEFEQTKKSLAKSSAGARLSVVVEF